MRICLRNDVVMGIAKAALVVETGWRLAEGILERCESEVVQ